MSDPDFICRRHSSGDDPFHLGHASIMRRTERAMLCELTDRHGKASEIWIPLSVVHDDSEVYVDDDGELHDDGELIVKRFFIEKNYPERL